MLRIGWRAAAAALTALAVSLAPAFGETAPARSDTAKAEPPACRGTDLLPELISSTPEALKRIETAAADTPNGEALLWRVERGGRPVGYLFGTMHLTDERVTSLSPVVTTALEASRHLALEIADISPSAFMGAIGRIRDRVVLEAGRSLSTMLGPDELAVAGTAIAQAGLPAALLPRLRPWLVNTMMSMTDCERTRVQAGLQPLDFKLATLARSRNITVSGLETIEGQLLAMASMPEADQLTMLKGTIKTRARAGDLVETILQRYLAREIAKVIPMQAELLRSAGGDPAALASFSHAMLTVRNTRMRDAAIPLMAEGGAFIAVGALHLVGREGLVALFREAGFSVYAIE
jgi:uncharacterized protein YbaP (TraB family)